MRLEMKCAIWNFWNFSNLSCKVAYLKLSDETWNEMCYLKLFKPIMEGCLFETVRWDLKWDVLFETFQTYHGGLLIWNFQMRLEMRCAIWNLSNLSWRVAYLKLSDETWNEMCYLKLVKPIMEGCLFETFRWDLKWDVLFETFETCQTYHGGLLIWNFQMRLEMRCAIRNFWNLSNLSLFETFRWD